MTLISTVPADVTLMCDMGIGPEPCVVSLVGAGGKTSTLYWLAKLLSEQGRRVLIMTSTQMFMPSGIPGLICRDPLRLPDMVFQQPQLALFNRWQPLSGKVGGFGVQTLDALSARSTVDIMLVEADGSRGLPIKAPALHEPCIPSSSRCVIAVSGGTVWGQPLGPECVHRWDAFSAITGASMGDTLSQVHLQALLNHPQGMFKNAPQYCRRVWLVNRYSQNENFPPAVFATLTDFLPLTAVWLGAVQESPAIRYRLIPSFSGHRTDI